MALAILAAGGAHQAHDAAGGAHQARDAGQVRFHTPGLARCVFTRRAAYSPRPLHLPGDGGRAAARGQRPRPACPCLPIPTSWRRLQAHSATAPQVVHAVRAVPRAWWRLGGATHRFLVLILLRLPAPRGANSFLLSHSAIEVVRLHGGCRGLAAVGSAAANSARGCGGKTRKIAILVIPSGHGENSSKANAKYS